MRQSRHNKKIQKDCYTFPSCEHKFSLQKTRFSGNFHRIKYQAFVGTNNHFIYKGFNEAAKLPNDEVAPTEILNDVLLSHSLYPDSGIEWRLLFSIAVHESPDYVCPICLFPPVAPRITKCGHIFCADCLRRLLASNEPEPCPVCSKMLKKSSFIRCELDLSPNDENETLTFIKMKRNQNNCLCYESKETNEEQMTHIPTVSQHNHIYNRFSIAEPSHVKEVIESELREIEEQKRIYSAPETEDVVKVVMLEEERESIAKEEIPSTEEEPEFFLEKPHKVEYFYQEKSGKNIYLSSLTRKMLIEQFGSLENSPDELKLGALGRKYMKSGDDFNRHHSSLNHITSDVEVEFIVADLSDVVSSEIIMKHYQDLIGIIDKYEKSSEHDYAPPRSTSAVDFRSYDAPVTDYDLPQTEWSFLEDDFPSFGDSPAPIKKHKKSAWDNISFGNTGNRGRSSVIKRSASCDPSIGSGNKF